jgi:hypothetical protein
MLTEQCGIAPVRRPSCVGHRTVWPTVCCITCPGVALCASPLPGWQVDSVARLTNAPLVCPAAMRHTVGSMWALTQDCTGTCREIHTQPASRCGWSLDSPAGTCCFPGCCLPNIWHTTTPTLSGAAVVQRFVCVHTCGAWRHPLWWWCWGLEPRVISFMSP